MAGRIDVHQHLWPPELVEALRRRATAPMLRGWTLHTAGEAPYPVVAEDHDVHRRRELEAGTEQVLVSLSSPLGIEYLPPQQAGPLLDAWHEGARRLGPPFTAWASVNHADPDTAGLADQLKALLLADRTCGLQVPASAIASPRALEHAAPLLARCAELDRPVLVHAGAVPAPDPAVPGWWPALVDYPAQLQAAWWAWQVAGRFLVPDLRICFTAGAGLAPLHHERFAARGGHRLVVDRGAFVDTSSYGRQAVDALIRALGVDVIVLGSDRPYAEPFNDPHLGAAAHRAIGVDNPVRLLRGESR
jgi:predicted TIM-barrel fold metal-dependent hydrolase